MENRITPIIYIDFDDTIYKTSEAIIKALNDRYGLRKSIKDLKDKRFLSIYAKLDEYEIYYLLLSKVTSVYMEIEEEFKEGFVKALNKLKAKSIVRVLIEDAERDIDNRGVFITGLSSLFKDIYKGKLEFVTWQRQTGENHLTGDPDIDIDMKNDIYIDDRLDRLENSNAKIKILYNKNGFKWNRDYANIDNLYVCTTWEEITDVVVTVLNNIELY